MTNRKPILINNTSQLFTGLPVGGKATSEEETSWTLEGGCVLVGDMTILDTGLEQNLRAVHGDASREWDIFDAGGKFLMPGFVDPHTHPVFGGTREREFVMRLGGATYQEIAAAGGGIRSSVRDLKRCSEDELFDLLMKRLDSFLLHGTTTIEAKSGYGLSTETELKSLRVIKRANEAHPVDLVPTFLGAHEIPDRYRDRRDEYITLLKDEMMPVIRDENLAEFCDIFCEENVYTVEESRDILSRAKELGFGLKIHADELSPSGGAELAAELGALTADHLVNTSARGIGRLAEEGVIPVLLPGTTFFLRSFDYAPAREMVDAGLTVAIATDFNPGSSMTESMQMIVTLASLYMGLTPLEALLAATRNSALAAGRGKRAGTLEKGKDADLILMDVPNIESIPYHFGVNHVRNVMKRGVWIVRNGRLCVS